MNDFIQIGEDTYIAVTALAYVCRTGNSLTVGTEQHEFIVNFPNDEKAKAALIKLIEYVNVLEVL